MVYGLRFYEGLFCQVIALLYTNFSQVLPLLYTYKYVKLIRITQIQVKMSRN